MTFTDFQEAVLLVLAQPLLELLAFTLALSILAAVEMPILTIARLMWRHWRPGR